MIERSRHRRRLSLLLLATLLLRAAIPDGYMPASPDSGLLFELCPSAVPAGFIAALGGSDHHQHHGASDGSGAHYDASQCPIGHMLSSAAAVDDLWQFDAISLRPDFATNPDKTLPSRILLFHRSRGPPA
jgi:hypothetical protein